MVDRGAILTEVFKRNAVRRDALLPVLNVQAVFREEVARASWKEFLVLYGEETRSLVLKQQRERFGQSYPNSVGARWTIEILTSRALKARFQAQ